VWSPSITTCSLWYASQSPLDQHTPAPLAIKSPVMIVSNTSIQKSGKSSFAWLIAHEHTLVWQGTGLASGPETDTYSRHAKANGLFAALTFLTFYVQCYNTPVHHQMIKYHCNNIGVITNLKSMQDSAILQANDTTNDNHNIYTTITAMATACHPLKLQYLHQRSPRP